MIPLGARTTSGSRRQTTHRSAGPGRHARRVSGRVRLETAPPPHPMRRPGRHEALRGNGLRAGIADIGGLISRGEVSSQLAWRAAA